MRNTHESRGQYGSAGGAANGVVNPVDPARRIRAVLFDVDGTLYRQRPVRLLMALELLSFPFRYPADAWARWKALRAFRKAQEGLRDRRQSGGALAGAQIREAVEASGLPVDKVEALVDEWMQRRPLKYLRMSRMPGVLPLLAMLDAAQVPLGVLSDYPAEAKLQALGLGGRFSVVMCATDQQINAFKPSPRGFLRACATLGLPPGEVLMVGDRADVDAAGAHAAGMPCVIIGSRLRPGAGHANFLVMPSFERLTRVLDARG